MKFTKYNKTFTLKWFLSSLALGIVYPNILLASDINSDIQNLYSLSLEDILNTTITTSSFFAETDLDAGSTVTVISQEYWQDRGARRLDDALSYMPGVTTLPSFLGTRQWAVRGYPNSNAAGLQTLWDGVPLNAYSTGSAQSDNANLGLNSLDSIEVIRGPGSALYGSDAMYGVVSLKAYESDHNEQIGSIRAGADGYYDATLKGSYAIANGWRANIALTTNGQPDQDFEYEYLVTGNPTIGERDYNYTTTTTSIKFNSDAKKQLSYKLGIYYNANKHDGFYHNGTDVPSNDTSTVDTDFTILKAETNFKINSKQTLTLNMSNWEFDRHYSRILPNLNTINIFAEEKQNTVNVILKDETLLPNTELSLALGYKDNEVETAHRTVNAPSGAELLTAPLFFTGRGRSINSFLLDGKSHFTKGENIFRYGFRLDDYSDFGQQFTPRIGFIRYLSKTNVIKFLYGNSFRAPTGNELYGGPQQIGDLNLQPEELDTYELIYISKHKTWKTETALFFSELKNGIQTIDTDNNMTPDTFANIAESDSIGIEISYIKKISNWSFDINGSYIISQNQTDEVDYTIFPEYIINVSGSYKFTNQWHLTLNNRIETGRTRVQQTTINNPDQLPNYVRTDLGVTKYYTKNIKMFVNIRNLFNRDNELPSIQDSVNSSDFTTGILEPGTKLDFGVHIRF